MKVLTLDELYDIFETEQYDQFRTEFGEDEYMERKTRKRPTGYTGVLFSGEHSLLYQHIVAERLFLKPLTDYELREMSDLIPSFILQLVYEWMHPLAWIEEPEKEKLVTTGKVAREQYDHSRWDIVWKNLNSLVEMSILSFADERPLENWEDSFATRSIRNVHYWECITANTFEQAVNVMMDEGCHREDYADYKSFDEHAFRKSLMLIEEKRGGKQAAEILRLLQAEWQTIKTWKAMGIDLLSKDDVLQFEECLLHGFDTELEIWDKEESDSVKSKSPTPFIATDRAIKAVNDACICDSADWAAVVKILEEQGKWVESAYSFAADYINNVCGENVTSANSLARSIIYTRIKGTYPNWEIKQEERSREVPNKLRKYLKIGEVFMSALEK